MDDIAKEIGVTRPALYYHFTSKEELFLAVYESIDPLAHVSIEQVLATTNREAYELAFKRLMQDIIGNLHDDKERAEFVATVESTSLQVPSVLDSVRAQNDSLHEAFRSAFQHGIDIGALPAMFSTAIAAQYLVILVYGMSEALLRSENPDWNTLWPLIADTLFHS